MLQTSIYRPSRQNDPPPSQVGPEVLEPLRDLEARVWMVHARTPTDGVPGTLRLDPGALVFRPKYAEGGEVAIPLDRIKRAKRVLGSPVLEVRLPSSEDPKLMAFYFVRPPNLEIQQDSRFLARGRAKREAAVELMTSNLSKKDDVARWVRAIRSARKG